jgi:hypothetical protein
MDAGAIARCAPRHRPSQCAQTEKDTAPTQRATRAARPRGYERTPPALRLRRAPTGPPPYPRPRPRSRLHLHSHLHRAEPQSLRTRRTPQYSHSPSLQTSSAPRPHTGGKTHTRVPSRSHRRRRRRLQKGRIRRVVGREVPFPIPFREVGGRAPARVEPRD